MFATTRDTHSTDHSVEPARTSENSVTAKFGEFTFYEVGKLGTGGRTAVGAMGRLYGPMPKRAIASGMRSSCQTTP